MGQRPLIKDGFVVNVVELDDDAVCVFKTGHRAMTEREDAEYAAQMAVWQEAVKTKREEIAEVEMQVFMASGIAAAVKSDARKAGGNAAADHLDRVLVADAEVEAWQSKLADMKTRSLPERPRMVRTKRWIYPDDHIIGPVGGQIGDIWDGNAYIKPKIPEKVRA